MKSQNEIVVRRRVSMGYVDSRQVFFATYFLWMEEAYEELLVQLGHPLEGHVRQGVETPIVSVKCDYLRPTGLGDEVCVRARIVEIGRTSFRMEYDLTAGGYSVARGYITHVCTEPTEGQPVSVPKWLRDAVFVEPSA
jgi:YbgC/YbaW family acyl-CoA thioester hydrolase